MRIRKRFLSLSSVLPLPPPPPPPDPPAGAQPHPPPLPQLVQQKHLLLHPNGINNPCHHNTIIHTHSQPADPPLLNPSDHTSPIPLPLPPSTSLPSAAGGHHNHQPPIDFMQKLEGGDESETELSNNKNNNDTGRKESILCAEADSTTGNASGTTTTTIVPLPFTTAHLVLKGWVEEDRGVPIKKRRGSFAERVNVEEDVEEEKNEKKKKKRTKKSVKRGNVIMEGSRCSRVNGRGWRCCQPTLVGYALCEHHLGKGRVRSMASVRGKISTRKVVVQAKQHEEKKKNEDDDVEKMVSLDEEEEEEEEDEDLKEFCDSVSMVDNAKRKKLGMVKARSISSLLGQTNNC